MKRLIAVLALCVFLPLCSCAEPAEESNLNISSATQDESTLEKEPTQQSSADSETGVLSHSTLHFRVDS